MSNEVANRAASNIATQDDIYALVANEARGLKGGGDGKAFMKFSGNDGRYSYGAEDEPLALGDQLVMNPATFSRGWLIWIDGQVEFETMVGVHEGPQPEKTSLPDHSPYKKGDGPVEQYTIEFATTVEPFTEMVFQANNVSKKRALAALLKEFGNEYKLHPGELPVVEIDNNEFDAKMEPGSKRTVKKFAPKFKIVSWIGEAEMAAMREGTPEDYAEGDDGEEAEVDTTPVAEPVKATRPTPVQPAPRTRATPATRGRF